jgi:hypothetical protein
VYGQVIVVETRGMDPMDPMDPMDLLRLLIAPERLAVVGALAVEPRTVDDLVEASRADRRTAVETVARLVHAGLATSDGDTYALDADAWRELAQAIATVVPEPDPRIGFGMTDEERQVLARFFVGTRLTELPASRTKRLVVLERLALEFEPGVHYLDAEVNDILGRFHDDVASLRRALVDERLLDRSAGEYWRAGGRVGV